MNWKSLLQPTIEKIREDYRREGRGVGLEEGREEGRELGREEGREEERRKNTKLMKAWLEEQIRAGKVPEDVEPPVFGGNGNNNHRPGENGKEEG